MKKSSEYADTARVDHTPQQWRKHHAHSFPDYISAKVAFDGLTAERKRIRRRRDHFDVVVYEKLSKKKAE